MHQKLKMGMIGGGQGSFIGAVHRMAARLDGHIDLVCGSFSSNFDNSLQTGQQLHLPPHRIYPTFQDMIQKESLLPPSEKMDFVSIVTPNHLHFLPAKMAMEHGFDVVLDKPMTLTLKEALELQQVQQKTNQLFCLTHTYTGYPMVKQAKDLIASQMFGKIRKVYVEYPQAWLSTFLEADNQKQAEWRTNPLKSGIAGCMGDIGTHAFNLVEYITGLQITQICADLNIVIPQRQLDDDGAILIKLNNHASGVLIATQVAAGEENNLKIRIYGEKGGIEWQQENANTLLVKWLNQPTQIYRTGEDYNTSITKFNTRVPSGHPEGYLEAFANLYKNFALTALALKNNKQPSPQMLDFPTIKDGIRGMAFIESVVASAKSSQKWTTINT